MYSQGFEETLNALLTQGTFRLGSAAAVRQLTGGQNLCNVAMPTWAARPWCVTLLKQRFTGGAAVVPGPLAGDPDSQFAVRARLGIQWGVDGASELALVDYPASGCTFQVHAANLRVYFDSVDPPVTGGAIDNPALGAFIAPATRSMDPARMPGATLTDVVTIAAAGASNTISRPSRAVAYRLMMGANYNQRVTCSQVKNAVVLAVDYFDPLYAPLLDPSLYPHRERLMPLLAETTGLRIDNGAPEDAITIQVQWLLDLG